MNPYPVIIIALLLGGLLLEFITEILNLSHIREDLPEEFEDVFDADRYRKSQHYLRDTTRFGLITATVGTAIPLAFMLCGGFNWVDSIARSAGHSEIVTGIIFTAILLFGNFVVGLPFSIYGTFVLEERYGFNKTTPKTFIIDIIKGTLLSIVIGIPIYALVLWFFIAAGSLAWLYCWIAVTLFQLLMVFIAPVLIMPLFNKFIPLQNDELRTSIEDYAKEQAFTMKGVFEMDGSKRSAKTNAFFTGLGRFRRIVLFDTLIEKHSIPELLAVVAHEMGHYKKKHILKMMIRAILTGGLTFYLLSFFIGNEGLFAAFKMDHISVYAGILFFGFLYAPIGLLIGIAGNVISRKHEYEADAYAAETTGSIEPMITGLKKLSADNLSNLTPHPFKVFMEYSHPTVLQRIQALRRLS